MRRQAVIRCAYASFTVLCFMCACSDTEFSESASINPNYLTCLAFDCHSGTQLKIFPPVSGAHLSHLGGEEGASIGCETCHYRYYTNPLHKNGFINGFNWLYNSSAPGTIVIWDTNIAPGASFDKTTLTCSGLPGGCHGDRQWESGGGE